MATSQGGARPSLLSLYPNRPSLRRVQPWLLLRGIVQQREEEGEYHYSPPTVLHLLQLLNPATVTLPRV